MPKLTHDEVEKILRAAAAALGYRIEPSKMTSGWLVRQVGRTAPCGVIHYRRAATIYAWDAIPADTSGRKFRTADDAVAYVTAANLSHDFTVTIHVPERVAVDPTAAAEMVDALADAAKKVVAAWDAGPRVQKVRVSVDRPHTTTVRNIPEKPE